MTHIICRPAAFHSLILVGLLLAASASPVLATVYEVGPGKPYATLGALPTSFAAGDVINIYPKAGNAPYYEKIALPQNGTSASPITFQGVADAQGNLPILDGTNAVQAGGSTVNYDRGLIITGNGGTGSGNYLVIANLELRNANPGGTFYRGGTAYTYGSNAAGIFVQNGGNVTIRNCWIHDNSNGIQTGSKSQGVTSLLVEACRVENNGVSGSEFQHNFYNGAEPITVQYCYIGGLRSGANGQNFKDRGSGTIFRYNWIEGGPNDQLDLVEGGTRPAHAYVYGNVLVKNNQSGNGRLVLFGFDGGGGGSSRTGTLYFVNNTVITTRSNTTLFQTTSGNTVEAHNNIVYCPTGLTPPTVRSDTGTVQGSYNWISPGYVLGGATLTGTISPAGNNPMFVDYAAQNYRPATGSACINAGATTWPGKASTTPLRHYVPERKSETRPMDSRFDIGAYEYVAPPAPPKVSGFVPAMGQVSYRESPLTTMTVTFDKDVTIAGAHVTVTGATTGLHNDFTFAYTPASRQATLTWPAGLPNDTYTVTVSDTVAAAGQALDGETNPLSPTLPSGNGTAGGAFTAYVYRLVGDINQDRSVDVVDLLTLAATWGLAQGDPGFDAASDLNNDNAIDVVDLLVLAGNWNTSIPEVP